MIKKRYGRVNSWAGLFVVVEEIARSGGRGRTGCRIWEEGVIPFTKPIHMCHLQCVLKQIQFKWTSICFHFQGK